VPGWSSPIAGDLIPVKSADRQLFLRHALKLLLYQFASSGGRGTHPYPLGSESAMAAMLPPLRRPAAAVAATADALRAQPGLLRADGLQHLRRRGCLIRRCSSSRSWGCCHCWEQQQPGCRATQWQQRRQQPQQRRLVAMHQRQQRQQTLLRDMDAEPAAAGDGASGSSSSSSTGVFDVGGTAAAAAGGIL